MERIVDERGEVRLGRFSGPVGLINHEDFRFRTPMGREVRGWRKALAYHQFQFLAGLCDEVIFGAAVVNSGLVGACFAYVLERSSGQLRSFGFRTPLCAGVDLSPSPQQGRSMAKWLGNEVVMEASGGQRRLTARFSKGLGIEAIFEDDGPPMALCTRTGAAGWVYAQKGGGFTVSGTLSLREKSWDLAELGVTGLSDWSGGYMRPETFWNWSASTSIIPPLVRPCSSITDSSTLNCKSTIALPIPYTL